MENNKPENPSVYPDPMRGAEQSFHNQDPGANETGMTLRDYFAAKAMLGRLTSNPNSYGGYATLEDLADVSYEIADAMLEARES